MAEKRMFSKSIIDCDAFLEMPQGSQLLYFHLGMRADDDGFVDNVNKILTITGCRKNDVDVLISKQFLIPFKNGLVVIKHWKVNNYLRVDRYKRTNYLEEKSQLIVNQNGVYSLGIPTVYQEKNSKEKISIEEREKDKQKLSLSQQKFIESFPDKVVDCEFDDNKYNIDLLIAKIKESEFLTEAKNITLKSCLKLYDKITADHYKNYKPTKQTETVQEIIEKDGKKFDKWGNELL